MSDAVAVLGAGSWGTALAILISSTQRPVRLWGRDAAAMQAMAAARRNERYLPDAPFPESLEPVSELDALVKDIHHFLLVIPSHVFRSNLVALANTIRDSGVSVEQCTFVWGTKGFEPETGRLLSEVTQDVVGASAIKAVVSGPSFAREVALGMPTALTVGSMQEHHAETVAQWFRNESTRVYTNTDVAGVQLGGALKNVMAIATGISDGLGLGANARAAVITRGLAELTRLGEALGGKTETFMGLTGVGDLILTCTDDQSRNRRVGMGLGRGKNLEQVLAEIGQEAEGINTARELHHLSQRKNLDMPITEQVYKVLFENLRPQKAVETLLSRTPRAE